jgi:MtN3 and saliva related transmembrane protein
MDTTFIVGTIGSTLTTSSLLPQVIKLWKTKSVGDLSFLTYLSLTSGCFLWIVYGIMLKQPPIYIANIITFILSATVLFLKIKHR